MRWRYPFIFILSAAALSSVGCRPERAVRDNSLDASAGVNLVAPAVLAAEKITPNPSPSDDSQPDLVTVLSQSTTDHQQFLEAIRMADLVPELQSVGPYTLLAPTDEAWAKLPPGSMDRLLKPANRQQLQSLVRYHILRGRIALKDLQNTNGQVTTMSGERVVIKGVEAKVMVNDANVLKAENSAGNGVIYWIDGVLFQPI